MRARSLEQLDSEGLLERREADRERLGRWAERARRDLALSRDTLANLDPERAMTVAYEAGFRACAGLLGLAGYRLKSQPGHHRAALEGASHVIPSERVASLEVLDGARRFRNASLYEEAAPIAASDLDELHREVEALIVMFETKLAESPRPSPSTTGQ